MLKPLYIYILHFLRPSSCGFQETVIYYKRGEEKNERSVVVLSAWKMSVQAGLSHDGQRINAKCAPIGVHTKSLMETQ